MADTHQAEAPGPATAGTPEGELDPTLAPLGALFARLAEARWAGLLGSGRAEYAGTADVVPAAAVRATGVVYVGGSAEGWVRVALDLGGGAGARAQDNKALAAWVEGVGEGLGELLSAAVQVRLVQAGDRPEAGPGTAEGTIFAFSCTFGRRSGSAWLWLEPGLLDRCLQELGEAGGADAVAPAEEPQEPQDGAEGQPLFPPLSESAEEAGADRIDVLLDVPLQVSVELGRTERQIREILSLVPGSVLELERLAGDPLDVLVNGKRIARAEVVVVDERFAVRITEILAPEERIGPVA